MSSVLLAFLVGSAQGLLHAFGPDHCAAMATLGTMTSRKRDTFWMALRFALGHAAVLAVVATVCLLAGVGLSESFERWAEVFGGAVLVALAVAALLFPNSLDHGHPHLPGHDRNPHRHRHVSGAAGALMAFSGVRALLLALPPLLVGGTMRLSALSYLPGFALGILLGMGVTGLVFTAGFARLKGHHLPVVQRAIAVGSGGLGLFWIASRL